MNRKTPDVITFGCRLNHFESQIIKEHSARSDLEDTTIINSCAVTAEAERQLRQTIRKVRRAQGPEHKIFVTGCAAQINSQFFSQMAEVDAVIGNQEKLESQTYNAKNYSATPAELELFKAQGLEGPFQKKPRVLVNDIMSIKETAAHLLTPQVHRAKAFVQVQTGCDHRCTFCIIPYGRGPSRSVPVEDLVDYCQKLIDDGVEEIIITGVDITSYGHDLPGKPSLGSLIKTLFLKVPTIPRLRVSSIDCIEIDPIFLEMVAHEPRLMPHLHLSLQAGDDMILKRMKRRHLRKDAIALCAQILDLRQDMVFGADLITGFPTETEEMFENTMAIVDDCSLTWLHVFPYSQRTGTPAARIPNQIPKVIKKERAKRLREKGHENALVFLGNQVGTTKDILWETPTQGYTENFAPVLAQTPQIPEYPDKRLKKSIIKGVDKEKRCLLV